MHQHFTLLIGAFALVPCSLAQSLEPQVLLRTGDFTDISYGTAIGLGSVTVNDNGRWMAAVRTDDPDPERDTILVWDGFTTFAEDIPFVNPAGSTPLDIVADPSTPGGVPNPSLTLLTNDRFVWDPVLDLSPLDPMPNADNGLFALSTLLIREEQPTLASQYPAGSLYRSFSGVKANDAYQVLFGGTFGQTTGPASRMISILQVDLLPNGWPTAGTETVIVKTGDTLPGQSSPVTSLAIDDGSLDINENGSAIFISGSGGQEAVYVDSTLVALEGTLSPLAGRNYSRFFPSPRAATLNDHGDYAFRARVTGNPATDTILVRNGDVVAQENRLAPNGETLSITTSPAGIAHLTPTGELLWGGEWTNATGDGSGLFLDDRIVVQTSDAVPGPGDVSSVSLRTEQVAMSPNGRYVVCVATLTTGEEALLRYDLGEVGSFSATCGFNMGTLEWTAGFPVIGTDIEFAATDFFTPPDFELVFLIGSPSLLPPCTVYVDGDEVMANIGDPNAFSIAGTSAFANPIHFTVPIPDDPNLVGATFYFQTLTLEGSNRYTLGQTGVSITITD